jgi:hypothetical protein
MKWGDLKNKIKTFSSNNSLFITLFILLVYISNKLSNSIPLLASKDTKKLDEASNHDKYLLSTIVFYYYIFLFGFVLVIVLLNAITLIVFEDNENFVKNTMIFLGDFVSNLFPHLISSLVVVIPIHFIIFYLYRYGYIDNRVINFREEVNSWIMLSSFIIYFSILYSYRFFHPQPQEFETISSTDVMNKLTKKLTEQFTTHYLGNQKSFEEFVEEYGTQKDKTAYLLKSGGTSEPEKIIPPGTVKNMLELKEMLDSMMNKSTKSNKNEMTTPWMVAKNITKIMKKVYTSSEKSFAPHLQSMNYTMSLFVLYIILSTFKWIPSKSKPKTNTEETKEEKQARENKEKNRDDKNRLIFTLIKVILVISVMLTRYNSECS